METEREPQVETKHELELNRLRESFEEARPLFDHLVVQMERPLREGKWTGILGDDVSGRIPALVFGYLMDRIAQERGVSGPAKYFFADERKLEERSEEIQEYLHSIKEELGERTLVVTEHIRGGRVMDRIADLLRNEKISFDVATLTGKSDLPYRPDAPLGLSVYTGNPRARFAPFFNQEAPTGLRKGEYAGAVAERNPDADQALVAEARKMAKALADDLYEQYFVQHGEK